MCPAISPSQHPFDRLDAVVLAAVCLFAIGHVLWFDHTADDAYVSCRYVDSWVRGYGSAFNRGEPVVGYSNFLWVVVFYPFGLLRFSVHLAASILEIGLAWATLARVYAFATKTPTAGCPASPR